MESEEPFQIHDLWEELISVPARNFQMGHMNSRDSAPYREVTIEKPFLMRKYPVTNLEFYRFINESGYKTEAQTFVDGIVYHRGSFITNFHHIAHWRRLSLLTNYCTSFLGFRTVCEEE
mgnify:CR=1 FL=1